MAKITTSLTNIVTGVSDDDRISYASCQDGPTIDGRRAWRGYYLDPLSGMVDKDLRVDPADWAAACELMSAVDRVEADNSECARQRDLDLLNARRAPVERAIDLASHSRGSHYDAATRKSN